MLWRFQKWIHWVLLPFILLFCFGYWLNGRFNPFFFFWILWWMKKKAWINKWNAIKFRGQKKNLSNSKPTWLSLQSNKILLFFSFYVHIKFKRKHNSTFISLFDKNEKRNSYDPNFIVWRFMSVSSLDFFFFLGLEQCSYRDCNRSAHKQKKFAIAKSPSFLYIFYNWFSNRLKSTKSG